MPAPHFSNYHPYIDALPRFHIATLDAHFRRGADYIVWYDQDHAVVGDATVDFLKDNWLQFSFSMKEAGCVASVKRSPLVQIGRRIQGANRHYPSIVCIIWKKTKRTIMMFELLWARAACNHAHKLIRRLSSTTRESLEIQRLKRIAEAPRPAGMRHAEYERICAEHSCRSQAWGSRAPYTLSFDQIPRVTTRYFAAEDLPPLDGPERLMGNVGV